MVSNVGIGTIHTVVYFSLTPLRDQEVVNVKRALEIGGTYVSHGSTRATLSISTLLTHRSRRTMLQFLYVVLSQQNFDSSTGQGERASVERPFAAGHL